jgi:hypothetical protein
VADYALPSLVAMYALMGLFVAGALFFLLHAVRTGAVSGDETPKYRMLEDEDAPVVDALARPERRNA